MESSDDEKVSRRRGKPRCPKNYGRAKEWKAYNFQYRAYCVSRGNVAVEIAAGKKLAEAGEGLGAYSTA